MNLHTEAVTPALWKVLLDLMATPPLEGFYLAGGTALALHYGHRQSIDIDLFTDQAFDAVKLGAFLSENCGLLQASIEPNTVSGVMHGIKVDCLSPRYARVVGVQQQEGIRLLAAEDIAAMKLNAIVNRGSKKDFWDLYELMQHFERRHLLAFFQKKYPQANLWTVEKSLSWFEQAVSDPDPRCLKGRTWPQIQSEISEWNRL